MVGKGQLRILVFTALGVLVSAAAMPARGQDWVVIDDFEWATSDERARQGVIDLTSPANQPAFYISGELQDASHGLFSIGTDSVFCINFNYPCEPGLFIGFRRLIPESDFPNPCGNGQFYGPLQYSYGDPDNPGPAPADRELSELLLIGNFYGEGAFSDGPTGTHLWVNLVDCEGEIFNYINYSEETLYSELWSYDVPLGQDVIQLDPRSLIDVPDGDRLLTEIAAFEVLIQDADDPPTTFGKWYIDYFRLSEPAAPVPGDNDGDGDVDLSDYAVINACLSGPGFPHPAGCEPNDADTDGDVDLVDVAELLLGYTGAL